MATINNDEEFYETALKFLDGVIDLARHNLDAFLAERVLSHHCVRFSADSPIMSAIDDEWGKIHADPTAAIPSVDILELTRLSGLLRGYQRRTGKFSATGVLPPYTIVIKKVAEARALMSV